MTAPSNERHRPFKADCFSASVDYNSAANSAIALLPLEMGFLFACVLASNARDKARNLRHWSAG